MGLVTGSASVQLHVVGEVAAVEVRLDGEAVRTVSGAPWSFELEFGPQLEPHELLVIARDSAGRELDRARQWINLGTGHQAGARMTLETDGDGRPHAVSLSWESLGMRRPREIEVLFDGEPLPFEDVRDIPLPPFDEDQLHFVDATLRFSDELVSRLSAAFGGDEEVTTELTAVPVKVERASRRMTAGRLRSWFLADGEPLRVHGVEKGLAAVIVVCDPSAQEALDRMAKAVFGDNFDRTADHIEDFDPATYFSTPPAPTMPLQDLERRVLRRGLGNLRRFARLDEDTRVRVISPWAVPVFRAAVTPEMFVRSEPLSGSDGGFLWLSRQVAPRRFPVQLANAVALAGSLAHGTGRRRAVVLVLGERAADESPLSAAVVRHYLRTLRVPLYVWTLSPRSSHREWGEVRYVGPARGRSKEHKRFGDAVKSLVQELDRQRIVWLNGHHLPQKVELAAEAQGLRLLDSEGAGRHGGAASSIE